MKSFLKCARMFNNEKVWHMTEDICTVQQYEGSGWSFIPVIECYVTFQLAASPPFINDMQTIILSTRRETIIPFTKISFIAEYFSSDIIIIIDTCNICAIYNSSLMSTIIICNHFAWETKAIFLFIYSVYDMWVTLNIHNLWKHSILI